MANSSEQEALEEKQAIAQLLIDKVTINREGRVTIQLAIPAPEDMATLGVLQTVSSYQSGYKCAKKEFLFALVTELYEDAKAVSSGS